ncbi:tumor necrosis factor receptor superfamily member 6B [Discoglossus pictus]
MCKDRIPVQCVFAALLIILGCTASSVPIYKWTDPVSGEELTCQQCPPGTFVVRHCSAQTGTQCGQCPELHYTQYWNYVDRCRYCNVFCGDQEQVKLECNATHNRVCECRPGYHRGSHFCVRHTKCGPGFGVAQEGTPDSDTKCVQCPPGTFSETSSESQRCQPHQDCSDIGLHVNVPGTLYHNTLCTTCLGTSNSREFDADCDQAIMEFMIHQHLSQHQLRRLHQIITRECHLSKHISHKKLHVLLTHLKSSNPGQPFLNRLLKILKRAGLSSLERQVRQKFQKHDL